MPPTIEADLLLCATFMRHDNQAREAVVTYALDTGTIAISAQEWAEALQNVFTNRLKSLIDSQVAITRTTTVLGDGSEAFTTGESTSAAVFGTNNDNRLPSNCALLVKKLTGTGGRRNRGRLYLPWSVSEADCDELGNIGNAAVAGRQAAFDLWLADLQDGDAEMVVAQRFYDRAWDIPGRVLERTEGSVPVTALVVESMLATQRRRMPRQ